MRVDFTHIPRCIQTCDMNCGSAFEPGASGLPYYCTSRLYGPGYPAPLRTDIWHASLTEEDLKGKVFFFHKQNFPAILWKIVIVNL